MPTLQLHLPIQMPRSVCPQSSFRCLRSVQEYCRCLLYRSLRRCSLSPPYGIAHKSSVIAVPVCGCGGFKGNYPLVGVTVLHGNTAAVICPVKVGGRVWRFGYESENIAVGGFGYLVPVAEKYTTRVFDVSETVSLVSDVSAS